MKGLVSGTLILTLILALTLSGADARIFLNPHSIVLVFGGTLGVFLLATPVNGVTMSLRTLLGLFKPEREMREYGEQLTQLLRRKDAPVADAHPLVAYAQELWEKGVEKDVFRALLTRRAQELNGGKAQVVAALRNLAKYPPALGMTGTVIGLVSLFSHLTLDNRQALGPNLALAMTATFYGLIVANMFLMPLADRIHVLHLKSAEVHQHLIKVILMIHQGEGDSVVKDEIHAA